MKGRNGWKRNCSGFGMRMDDCCGGLELWEDCRRVGCGSG